MKSNPALIAAAFASAGLFAASGPAAAQTPVGPQPAPVAGPPTRDSAPATAAAAIDDPWERTNRKIYAFNTKLDRVALRPGVVFYHHATPTPIRHGVHNILLNMTHPIIIMNDAVQLRPSRFMTALGRFAINSTAGVGGVFDVATRIGLPYHSSDFGQTLGRYGVSTGPYVFLPILGPSTVRDLAGRGVDAVADPFNSIRYDGRDILAPTRSIVGGIDARDQVDPLLKDLNRTATDPYATVRSLYFQNRAAQVRGDAASAANVQALPDFGPASSPNGPAAPQGAPNADAPGGADAAAGPVATPAPPADPAAPSAEQAAPTAPTY